jgi:hypothetical protein
MKSTLENHLPVTHRHDDQSSLPRKPSLVKTSPYVGIQRESAKMELIYQGEIAAVVSRTGEEAEESAVAVIEAQGITAGTAVICLDGTRRQREEMIRELMTGGAVVLMADILDRTRHEMMGDQGMIEARETYATTECHEILGRHSHPGIHVIFQETQGICLIEETE